MKTLLLLVFALVARGEIRTTAKRLPGGATTIEVWNDATAPRQEFVVELPYTLPRNGKGRIPELPGPVVNAAIFADGSTAGEADLIRRLILRRANLLQAVELSLALIGDAGRHNTSRARMIADFKRLAESVHRWYLPEEQQTGFRVYQSITGKLTNMVEGPVGAAFPQNEFVAQETAALNRQRTALLASQPSLADPAQNGR